MRSRKIGEYILTGLAFWVVIGTAAADRADAAGQALPRDGAGEALETHGALIDRYCVTCHNERTKTAGLELDSLDLSQVGQYADVWEKVVRKLRGGLMPPMGRPRPTEGDYRSLVSWLESELDRWGETHPNPGRKQALHRLNRTEYQNTIRDLLALEIDIASMLPPDEASYGFDNIAGSLRISQSALEQYLSAARRVSRAAIGTAPPGLVVNDFRIQPDARQDDRIEGLPFGTRGGMLVSSNFPQDGEYEIEIELMCDASDCDGAAGFPDPHELEITVDGRRVQLFALAPRQTARPKEDRDFRARVTLGAGPHDIAATFLALPQFNEVDQRVGRFIRPYFGYGSRGVRTYQPYVARVSIKGPFNPTGPGDTPSRQKIFTCGPTSINDQLDCAKKIVSTLARRAYRRPISNTDLEPLIHFYEEGAAEGGFERGIETALRRLLVSPEFLFRVERDPEQTLTDTNYHISDLELASRLSFFLWSSIPDDRLLDLATGGKLTDQEVLEQEVRRMLEDTRSKALVNSFAAQWLALRNLEAVSLSLPLYPEWGTDLREGFRRETELFVESILSEDRSVLELLTADYTFVNERLAQHYGIPNVSGPEFQRVRLADENRRGLLNHGSVLAVTSRPNRTSPVLRGKWILENILGTPPPPPPASVPPLAERKIGSQANLLAIRDRMAEHRENPACASCHSMIDPLGFALENFDAIGKWRDLDASYRPIDTSGKLPDGTMFDGLASFRAALLSKPERFVTTLTEKLLTYALGRGLESFDMPAVRGIVRQAAARNYTFSDLVVGITESVPFQMRRSGD